MFVGNGVRKTLMHDMQQEAPNKVCDGLFQCGAIGLL